MPGCGMLVSLAIIETASQTCVELGAPGAGSAAHSGNRGDVAQLGERLNRTQEGGGSNPLVSTIFFNVFERLLRIQNALFLLAID